MLSSGANHEAVDKQNPHWTVEDWCFYWGKDLEKAMKRAELAGSPQVRKSCDHPDCKCKDHPWQ